MNSDSLMAGNSHIIVLGELERVNNLDNGVEIINLEFEILGEPLHFSIAACKKPAKLSDIVPLARVISSTISETLQKTIIRSGGSIPCQKGCAVCCHYLVLLSVPEALRLSEEIMHLSLKQFSDVIESCSTISKSVQQYFSETFASYDTDITTAQGLKFAHWYYWQKKTCPFLHKNSCSIYEQRPITCRKCLVEGTIFPCNFKGGNKGRVVDVPISISQALKTLTCDLNSKIKPEFIILPCMFNWYKQNKELSNRTWPAVTIVKRFVEIIKTMEAEIKYKKWVKT